jgi:hypothetical protein
MRTVVFLAMLAASLLPVTAGAAQTDADKATAQRISTHLQQSGQLRNYRIGVTYQDGVASLAGTVADADQCNIAIRLAEQVKGVTRVDCQLQHAERSDSAVGGNNRRGLANAFETAAPAPAQSRQSGVVQASGNNQRAQAAPAQRSPMLARNNAPMNRPRPMPRGNMPLPAPRFGADPAVRQASAVYPAGGAHGQGFGGPMGPGMGGPGGPMGGQAVPAGYVPHAHARGPSYENPQMPGYAWPSYASYPNYAALSYPQQYSPTAWPYIGPFYPYPQVPLAWRKVSLEWDDGWWFLDFSAHNSSH